MSDPETPAFQVVDRRSASQPPISVSRAEDASAVSAPDARPSAETAPELTDARRTPDVPLLQTSAFNADTDADTDADSVPRVQDSDMDGDADDTMQMPDPAALLPYVALQMDARSLAGTLLGVFDAQAWRALGLVASPVTGQAEKNLPDAQLAIDCVQFLLGKVESSLAEPERREMHRRLNDLRMNYLAKLREG